MKLCQTILLSELSLVRYRHDKNFSPKSALFREFCCCIAQKRPFDAKFGTNILEAILYDPNEAQPPRVVRSLVIKILTKPQICIFKIRFLLTETGPTELV